LPASYIRGSGPPLYQGRPTEETLRLAQWRWDSGAQSVVPTAVNLASRHLQHDLENFSGDSLARREQRLRNSWR
jgi:hypothetical protein